MEGSHCEDSSRLISAIDIRWTFSLTYRTSRNSDEAVCGEYDDGDDDGHVDVHDVHDQIITVDAIG